MHFFLSKVVKVQRSLEYSHRSPATPFNHGGVCVCVCVCWGAGGGGGGEGLFCLYA